MKMHVHTELECDEHMSTRSYLKSGNAGTFTGMQRARAHLGRSLKTRRVTRDTSVIIHPLTYGILQLVLDFVGPGNYLFVSLVNKAWNDAYKSVQSVAIPRVCNSAYEKPESITCAPSMTATSAVFAAPARLLLAEAANFQLDTYWSRPWISVAASTAD
eukprot:8798-Heterococcus_DN1.PRE.1